MQVIFTDDKLFTLAAEALDPNNTPEYRHNAGISLAAIIQSYQNYLTVPSSSFDDVEHVADAAIEAALAVRYPDEWPDAPVFQKLNAAGTETFEQTVRREMRAEITAALSALSRAPQKTGRVCALEQAALADLKARNAEMLAALKDARNAIDERLDFFDCGLMGRLCAIIAKAEDGEKETSE